MSQCACWGWWTWLFLLIIVNSTCYGSEAEQQLRGSSRLPTLVYYQSDEDTFNEFIQQYRRPYVLGTEEYEIRLKIFQANINSINDHNEESMELGASVRLAPNGFTDLSLTEFRLRYGSSNYGGLDACSMGSIVSSSDRSPSSSSIKRKAFSPWWLKEAKDEEELPAAMDWRDQNVTTPVRNQEACGCCWAVATAEAVESLVAIETGVLTPLSVQQLVDCAGDFENYGCSGGMPSRAFEYIKQTGGLVPEAEYPFVAADQTCELSASMNHVGQIQEVYNISRGDLDTLQRAVAFNGPVAVGMNVNFCLQFYSEGIIYPDGVRSTAGASCLAPGICGESPQDLNHAVLIVGYGTESQGDFPNECIQDPCDYWIIKNSWGEGWGMQGYLKMFRSLSINTCGIATCASFPLLSTGPPPYLPTFSPS